MGNVEPDEEAGEDLALVTVIIPSFNSERTIRDALKSLREQTMTDWEAIVVDGGSDGTYGIAQEFAIQDSRIKVIKQYGAIGGGFGHAYAWNMGLILATSPYLATLDADDYWFPDKLAETTAFLENEQKCTGPLHTGVFTDYIEWDEPRWLKFVRRSPEFDADLLLSSNYVCFSTLVARRPFWLEPKWEPVADWEAVVEASKRGPLARLPKILAVRRVHEGQVSAQSARAMTLKALRFAFHNSLLAGLKRLRMVAAWHAHNLFR